jgi:hypothetical protein
MSGLLRTIAASSFVASALLLVAGCGQTDSDDGATSGQSDQTSDDHSGWWCAAHGVPEEECSMCGAAEKYKAKGDWCEEHNRAESQCFICNPDRAEKYVALYEAKFGTKPPAHGGG